MAKCFQLVGQGIPVRMSNADAFQIVDRDKDGQYCPKSVWKKRRASDYCVENNDNCLGKLMPNGRIVATETLHFNAQRKKRRA